ncbi:hypothetical protein ACIBJI_34835 [Nocardia sp. NPDC050408]
MRCVQIDDQVRGGLDVGELVHVCNRSGCDFTTDTHEVPDDFVW